ncbi:MAG TPA: RdgB/HAM1 family non-canonical purine NTP pyrophosphatase [Candidatus Angelobacter sp.]|jgi:XTP/dITP diphosphohydrolase|nr:RdgB/HAM1 family non-canonical purine NTP pyrophosphatase [Candidatus Angelobacter sp.]
MGKVEQALLQFRCVIFLNKKLKSRRNIMSVILSIEERCSNLFLRAVRLFIMIHMLSPIYIATSNPGKLRDFRGAASSVEVEVRTLPDFKNVPLAVEDGQTFEQNARIKAEHYSRFLPGELVLADDSGLAVDALNGAPGVHSARYAALVQGDSAGHHNSDDEENNRVLIQQLEALPEEKRGGRFVCVIAAAKDGATLQVFEGEVRGKLLTGVRGSQGFGYDPLFYFPGLGKTFAEIPAEEKAEYSHRGKAFRAFLAWYGGK